MSSSAPQLIITFFLLVIIVPPLIAFFKVSVEGKLGRGAILSDEVMKKFREVFAEPTERYIASIGNGYIINFLSGGSLASGFSVISNKRVYFKGKCYYKEAGKLKKSFEERMVDLKDVTGTGYTRVNPTSLLITSLSSLVLTIILIGVLSSLGSSDQATVMNILTIVLIASVLSFSITLTAYILKRKNLFEISFAGGMIAFNINLYDKAEIDDFQKQLRRAKDHVVELAPSQVAAAAAPQAPTETISKLGIADEIKKYSELLQQKLITQEEFDEAKKNLLSNGNK
ncbi:SHOCT domain-containing protein [Paenibacillus dendritiformis]|uniref:SHOCT domain-containing protein n=1 Tax=Paenibacillus dendritiformis TaxID=130049 RepID=UPI001BCFD049|nr:SHOCT domain-containing protein [Paenibacillus dendritiformis]